MGTNHKINQSIKKKKPFIVRLIRIAIILFLGGIGIFLFLIAFFYLNKDNISRELISDVNKRISGELSFEDISINPFVQFPSISLTLVDVEFYENHKLKRDSAEKPIARIEKVHGGIDIIELVKGHIDVSKITLEKGNLDLVYYNDSTFNFLKAVAPRPPGNQDKNPDMDKYLQDSEMPAKSDSTDSNLALSLNQIYLKNIDLEFRNLNSETRSIAKIRKMKASLIYMPEAIHSSANISMDIRELQFSKQKTLRKINMRLKTSIKFDRDKKVLSISPSLMEINKALIHVQGIIDFEEKMEMDLELDGSDEDISFLSIFLTRPGIKNIRDGDVYFSGSVKGHLQPGIPEINCDFGLRNLNIRIPGTNQSIQNMDLSGHFNSGQNADLSQAWLKIDTITASLPEGYINGRFYLQNFTAPYLDYEIDLKTNLRGFDKIFKFEHLTDLLGTISIRDQYSGQFLADSGWTANRRGDFSILFDSISCNIPDMDISLLDGSLRGNLDSMDVLDLLIETGNTDLLIDGTLYNISQFLIDEQKNILADLTITASSFDLPEFLSFDPKIGRSFPYRINDIVLDILLTTNRLKLNNFDVSPEICFDIKHLDATIENLFPPIEINQGIFILGESDSLLHLDFNHFDIQVAGSRLNTTLDLYRPPDRSLDLVARVDAQNLNPGKLFYYKETDTIPKILNAYLNGRMDCNLHFIKDSVSYLRKLDFNTGLLSYTNSADTIETDLIHLDADNIDYVKGENLLSNLSANINLWAGKIKTSKFKFDNIHLEINAQEGTYTILPEKINWFGKEGTGKLVFSPFNEPPSYDLMYSIEQFPIENLLESFMEKPSIMGEIDFNLELKFKGNNWKTIAPNLNGKIHLTSKNLLFKGFNIDNFINKYERSQRFTLVDVGAVIIAGPLGLAVTKGTDFTRLAITDHRDSTRIIELNTEWTVKNGFLNMEDVAFTTEQNRMASKGWYNMVNDSLDITFAVLNQTGCGILIQNVNGSVKDPELGDLEVISKLLGPVTNLFKDAFGTDCEPFYTGKLKHPEQKDE